MGTLFLLLLAISVKQDHTPLRTGCASDTDIVATLPSGAPVTIRYALSGEATPCYKVAVEQDGKTVEGYLSSTQIEGLDEFDQKRRDASWLESSQVMASLPALAHAQPGIAAEASRLIEASQPAKALQLLDPELRKNKDPNLLALAGIAAWRADDSRKALDYWRTSLSLAPNKDLERIFLRVERETKGDQSSDKLVGMRVVLRYDSSTVSADAAREMLGALDHEFTRISGELGCNAEERIVAIVQSQEAYRKTVDVAEWNGGQYDGRIRVPVLGGQGLDASTRRVFAHETTHACLSMLGRWPAWFQEGLAQKLSGDKLSAATRQKLDQSIRSGQIPRLENLRQDWSRMDTEHATNAYALSLAAVELFYENYTENGIGNLVRDPLRLPAITADLDKRLGLQ